MTSINGVDPIVVDTIKVQTQKTAVIETQKTKISQDKRDREKKENKSEHSQEQQLQSLIKAVDRLNHLLEINKIPLYFQIIGENAGIEVKLINAQNQNVITVMLPEKVISLAARFNTTGFTLDELI